MCYTGQERAGHGEEGGFLTLELEREGPGLGENRTSSAKH